MMPTMMVPINSLKPLAPFGVSHANGEEEQGGADINQVRVSGGEDKNRCQYADDVFNDSSVFHDVSGWLLKSDQGGKSEKKLAAFSFLAFHPDISAVSENNFAGDAQAQARPLIAALRDAKKLVEDSPA